MLDVERWMFCLPNRQPTTDNCPPVIGVAKTPFHNSIAIPITRGQNQSPRHIPAIRLAPQSAARHIQQIPRPHRIPTLLKLADTPARQGG